MPSRLVALEKVELPALTQTSPTDGGRSATGNNDRGRRRQANRARITWRIVDLKGKSLGFGVFVDKESAYRFCAERALHIQERVEDA